jgi:hypothetical protein
MSATWKGTNLNVFAFITIYGKYKKYFLIENIKDFQRNFYTKLQQFR